MEALEAADIVTRATDTNKSLIRTENRWMYKTGVLLRNEATHWEPLRRYA